MPKFAVPRLRANLLHWLVLLSLLLLFPCLPAVRADTPAVEKKDTAALLLDLGKDDPATRKAAIIALSHTGDPRLIPFFNDFSTGNVYLYQDQIVLAPDTITDASGNKSAPLLDPLSRQPLTKDGKPRTAPLSDLKDISPSRRERILVRDALTLLNLTDPDPEARLSAVIKAGDSGAEATLPALTELQKTEPDTRIRSAVDESIALINLSTPSEQLTAVQTLGDLRSSRAQAKLLDLAKTNKDPTLDAALTTALAKIQHWQTFAQWTGYIFSGISSGSVLILLALGLSIIFGLMGVINMAQGELMMIGAYATYVTEQAFIKFMPASAFNWFFIAAIPISFIAAALVGWLVEATVIRHLYGRPLETLLATWGVGLILAQAVRWEFGNNIGVNSPSWLTGGIEVARDIVFPYNRCFIIVFCLACVGLMYFIVDRTRLGLLIRATTQNRPMAASLGVSTRRIDAATFALGAGLAGLAGCALTQIGGVTPDMGQNYIVDSFMVVVTGGVGKLAGSVIAGLGLGCLNKTLEPMVQTVWAKVLVLMFVVAFIQKRPSGLFPAKGRLADV